MSYTTEHGLPQNQVVSMFQDAAGFLWFGTNGGGIARFDGQDFEVYTSRNGLLDNSCYTFFQDKNLDIWIGTNDGISIIRNSNYTQIDQYNGPNGELAHLWIRNIHEDRKGNIWFTTNNGLFQKTETELISYKEEEGLVSTSIRAITEDKNGNIWIGYDPGGIAKISERGIENFTSENGFIDDFVFDIEIDFDGNLWMACANLGLYQFDGQTFSHITAGLEGYSTEIRDLAIDEKGTIWVGSMDGIAKIIAGQESPQVERIKTNSNLKSRIIWKVFVDKNQDIWLGTYGGGVARLDQENYSLFDAKEGMIDDFMWSVVVDHEQRIWAGSIDQGLSVISYNKDEKKHTVSHTFSSKNGLIDDGVQAYYEDYKARMWIGTSTGLMICNLQENGALAKHQLISNNDLTSNKSIRCIYEISPTELLIGTSEGLYKMTENQNGQYQSVEVGKELKHHIIYDIDQDQENNTWIATGAGLFKLGIDGYITSYTNAKHLSNTDVRTVICDEDNELWLATGAGICLFNTIDATFKTIGYNEGLSSGRLYFIFIDSSKKMWVGSGTGIDLLNYQKYKLSGEIEIEHLGRNQGFAEYETNTNVITEDINGNIWIGTIRGMIRYNTNQTISRSIDSPIPIITGFSVFDSSLVPDSMPILDYSQNYISIKYVGLNYANPGDVCYQYMLSGGSEHWSPVLGTKSATFADLLPGEYEFIVKAGLGGKIDPDKSTSFFFTIAPAFWQTNIFKATLLLLAVALVLATFGIRTVKLKNRQVELANEVKKKTREVVIERDEARRQKDEASNQRQLAEQRTSEILDSINYAKRLQTAILPPILAFEQAFEDCFVMYQPKDIVAGDFYWMEKEEQYTLFAVADCTGHGVPGALVSVVCYNALNRAVREFNLTAPHLILDKATQLVIETFDKSTDSVKDGMDIAMCKIDHLKMSLHYAGAYNPLWLIRKGKVISLKADKQPIGMFDRQMPFNGHEIELQKNDQIYIFSDGYPDQFGGKKGKKFKLKPFQEMLLGVGNLPMDQQLTEINNVFSAWKGDLDQVDDICVVGVKI